MTKSVVTLRGMARKRERHMPLGRRLVGQCFVTTGAVLLTVLALLWSQYLFPTILDSHVAFNAVLNQYDQFTNDWTFKDFEHREQDANTDLFILYLWHVTNTENFIEFGYKPRLQEKGPYAYVKQAYKYDIEWSKDSDRVTYKEWWYLALVQSPEACRLMFFQQGLGEYNEHSRDHPAGCAPDSEEVTILNPKFMALQDRWTIQGIFGELSQAVFANIRNAMIARDAFPRTVCQSTKLCDSMWFQVKAELIPEALSEVWTYRLAVHASSALGAVVSLLGDSAAAINFASSDHNSKGVFKSPFASNLVGRAAFGTLDSIKRATAATGGVVGSEATLTVAEAAYLLQAENHISVLNYERGIPLWIGTARHFGLVQHSGLEYEGSLANQLAYDYIVGELATFGKSPQATEALALGIASYLYGPAGWMTSSSADDYRKKEWAGYQAILRGGGCDCGSYGTGLHTDVAISTSPGLFYYQCNWGLTGSLSFYSLWEDKALAPPINQSLTKWIIDPDYEDTRNEIGIHTDENLVRWWQAYEYCNVSRTGRSPMCGTMHAAADMTEVVLPEIISDLSKHTLESFSANANSQYARSDDRPEKLNGSYTRSVKSFLFQRYQGQTCAVAGHLYEVWALKDHWHELYVAVKISQATGLQFIAGRLEDFGYAQWGGGYITSALWGVPSVSNIERKGYWKFGMASYTTDLIEFHSQAMAIGYSNMNMSTEDARILLDALAAEGPTSRAFRGKIGQVATSYRCDGADYGNILRVQRISSFSSLAVMLGRFNRRIGRSEGLPLRGDVTAPPSPTCGPSYCDCKLNGSYFVTQNTFGNFLEAAPPPDEGEEASDVNYVHAASLLARTEFASSAMACQQIQDHYRQCSWLETEPRYSFWLVNCKTWETLISDPTYGIYCDLETILRIDSAYNHDYQSATRHPYPRRRGIVVAFWLQEWSTYRVLIEKRIVCDEPENCAYADGGLFVTHKARKLFFEGYVDRVSMVLLNSELEPHNLSARCNNYLTLELDEYCNPIRNIECTDGGFQIVDAHGTVRSFERNSQEGWHLSEIVLNLSDISSAVNSPSAANKLGDEILIIDNPVFAIYPGKLWVPRDDSSPLRQDKENTFEDHAPIISFHKKADCAHRFLGGNGNWRNCTTTLMTGSSNLNDVQRIAEWRGNATLITGDGFVDTVDVSSGTLTHQMRPYGWEGFRAYNVTYLMRAKGLNFQGADVLYVLNADYLMLIELKRQRTGDLEIGMADLTEEFYVEWPTRKQENSLNYTRRFWARANRYEVTSYTFEEGRRRAFDKLKDLHGEPYTCPHGMISLGAISDSPCFVSLPHFYGNEEWGGLEARQVYFDSKYDRRLQSYYVDIEPITGRAVREARRFQINFRVERNMQFPQIISSQARCEVPTADFTKNGYGCFMFFPVWWVSEERHIDGQQALRMQKELLEIPERLLYTVLYGIALGAALILLGMVPWYCTNRREVVFRERIYID